MSLQLSSRRALTCTRHLQPIVLQQQRSLFDNFLDRFKKKDKSNELKPRLPANILTEELLKSKPAQQQRPAEGDLAGGSILDGGDFTKSTKQERNPAAVATTLDPFPDKRKRFMRKMVIREIQKRGRLTRQQTLDRTERQLLARSHDFETSVKKLVPLAKQIAGKTVEDAIIQMRFSKKKAAKDVKAHLEYARDQAIVKRGMGLGAKKGENNEKAAFDPVSIITKDKERVTIRDPTTLYVDQAWCGKGLYGESPDYRARGKVHMMKNRTTSLTLILKEEATRLRLNEERETKIKSRKVWQQLPNRPVTQQRQYYSW